MNLNSFDNLVDFEKERLENNHIPPVGSNSFYTIGDGKIDIKCIRGDEDDYRFDIFIENGNVKTGTGVFRISGDIIDITKPYQNITVNWNSSLSVNDQLIINKGIGNIHGALNILNAGNLIVNNSGEVTFYPDSKLIIDEGSSIVVEDGSKISIYGEIIVHLSMVDYIRNSSNIYIDSAAVVTVTDIDLGDREYSLTDYDQYLRGRIINPRTQGEHNSNIGRIGYTWKAGSPSINSQILQMSVLWGEVVLGDFKLSILGLQESLVSDLQVIESLYIAKNSTLYITDSYESFRYLFPELYLGIVIGNYSRPAQCIVDGTIIVSGETSKISLDRGGELYINEGGSIYLQNKSSIVSTYNDGVVLHINGTLIIDSIDQINTLESNNIEFGENGKVIILNPDNGERKVLFSTPLGIHNTDLYRIFKENILHIEYHISENNGIKIDKYFEYYSRDMTDWYGGMRIEKAIHEGLIVWHDNAFIELDNDIIPWVNLDCSLLQASRIFKSYGTYDEEKIQEVVEHLIYAGSGDIIFRFVVGDESRELLLSLSGANTTSVVNDAGTETYIATVDNEGDLFIRNKLSDTSVENIISEDSKKFNVIKGDNSFQLN